MVDGVGGIRSNDSAWTPPPTPQPDPTSKSAKVSAEVDPTSTSASTHQGRQQDATWAGTYAKWGSSSLFSASGSGEGYSSKPGQMQPSASADRKAVEVKHRDDKGSDNGASGDASGKAPGGTPPPPPAMQTPATSGSPTAAAPASGLQQTAAQSVAAVAQNQLASRLQDPGFMSKTLGPNYDRGLASLLASHFAAGHPMDPSKVQVVDPSKVVARGADRQPLGRKFEGAFDKQSGTMYLSQDLFKPGAKAADRDDVIAQELMHHVAQTVDPGETSSGAEGVIASHELKGTPMTADQAASARQIGDHGTLSLGNGQTKAVEFGNPPSPQQEEAARAKVQQLIAAVNPTGGTLNCVRCARAVDNILRGSPPGAPGTTVRTSLPARQSFASQGQTPIEMGPVAGNRAVLQGDGLANIKNYMDGAPDGTTAIIFAERKFPMPGHVFNAIKMGGVVIFAHGDPGWASTYAQTKSWAERPGPTGLTKYSMVVTRGPPVPNVRPIPRPAARPEPVGFESPLARAARGFEGKESSQPSPRDEPLRVE